MQDVLTLSKALIAKPSITPNDHGCQELLLEMLEAAGFQYQRIDSNGTSNFFAWHGEGKPSLVFSGHTDVVPPGPISEWSSDPFQPTEIDGHLYGRGAADMKSAVAAMTLAAIEYVKQNPNHPGLIGLAITSDEEGPALDGSIKIVEYLKQHNLIPTYVLVGEASSDNHVGDAIKIGRRGSMYGDLTIYGKQGHIAYPDKAENPIHRCFKALDELASTVWDKGNGYFPPTSLQFYAVEAGVAANVIPGSMQAKFNFRFAPIHTAKEIQDRVESILQKHKLKYDIRFDVSSQPFFSGECDFSRFCSQAIEEITGKKPELNTRGGTSDGRLFAPHGSQVIELGAVNQSIHKINENINIEQLQTLQRIYVRLIELALQSHFKS